MNLMMKPAMMRKMSLNITIALSQMGNKLHQEREMTNAPTSSLSAIGSRNDPNLLACEDQVRAMKPSS